MNPLIVNIKRNSLDDGPGIRTTIFFKGCPLSCVWCQNPETKSALQEISFEKDKCTKYKRCVDSCNLNAIEVSKRFRLNRENCNLCGECINACPNDALKFVGKQYDINKLVEIILKDKTFYNNSGGGVTFSGGEPTFHINYLNELLIELKKENIHTCLETCGYYNNEKFKKLILPYMDIIYFDLKFYDSILHERYCKVPNKIIIQNFEDLLTVKSIELLPRIPLVPKINATDDNLEKLAEYLKSLGVKEIGLLPYNPLWLSKAETLGVTLEYNHSKWLTIEDKNRIKTIFSDFKFEDF